MRPWIYSLMTIALVFGHSVMAQSFKKTNHYQETFPLTHQMEVSIINKYGDIQIIHWEKDSVMIEVEVEVNSNKESKAEKLFQSIDIKFRNNFFYVVAETSLAGKSTVWNDISDKTKLLFNSNTTTRINYVVYMPNTFKLSIQNKYGQVYLGDYKGELDVNLSNGDFKAHHLLGNTKLKISFGDLYIGRITHGLLEANNAEAEIEECTFLETNTKVSKLRIEKIEELQMNSAHDKYYIGILSKVSGLSRYTFLKINELDRHIDISQKFGSMHFRHIDSNVGRFYLNTYKTDIHLSLSQEQEYHIDLRSIIQPVIQFPAGDYEKTEKVIDDEKGLKSTSIILGDKNSKALIPLNIQAEEGHVFINVK